VKNRPTPSTIRVTTSGRARSLRRPLSVVLMVVLDIVLSIHFAAFALLAAPHNSMTSYIRSIRRPTSDVDTTAAMHNCNRFVHLLLRLLNTLSKLAYP
jgi:hypothetical protein